MSYVYRVLFCFFFSLCWWEHKLFPAPQVPGDCTPAPFRSFSPQLHTSVLISISWKLKGTLCTSLGLSPPPALFSVSSGCLKWDSQFCVPCPPGWGGGVRALEILTRLQTELGLGTMVELCSFASPFSSSLSSVAYYKIFDNCRFIYFVQLSKVRR